MKMRKCPSTLSRRTTSRTDPCGLLQDNAGWNPNVDGNLLLSRGPAHCCVLPETPAVGILPDANKIEQIKRFLLVCRLKDTFGTVNCAPGRGSPDRRLLGPSWCPRILLNKAEAGPFFAAPPRLFLRTDVPDGVSLSPNSALKAYSKNTSGKAAARGIHLRIGSEFREEYAGKN